MMALLMLSCSPTLEYDDSDGLFTMMAIFTYLMNEDCVAGCS
jgi:hypothetical protein